jgi:hypothetical protein
MKGRCNVISNVNGIIKNFVSLGQGQNRQSGRTSSRTQIQVPAHLKKTALHDTYDTYRNGHFTTFGASTMTSQGHTQSLYKRRPQVSSSKPEMFKLC